MELKPIRLKYVNVFLLIKENDCILVDAGVDGDGQAILDEINRLGLNLKYIIVTHAHYDHAGGLAAVIKEKPVPVICHQYEVQFLKEGRTSELIPQGVTFEELIKTMNLSDKGIETFKPTDTEYIVIDEKTPLENFGFDGFVLPLAGHTEGSVCVFTPEDCICGDTVFNVTDEHFPPIYSDRDELINTFKYLKTFGCRYIYPSHGKRFKADEIKIPEA